MKRTKTRFFVVISKATNQIFQTESGRLAVYNDRKQAEHFAVYGQDLEKGEYKIKQVKVLIFS